MAVTPDGGQVYAANGNSATVSVIDTATHTTSGIPVGTTPVDIAIAERPTADVGVELTATPRPGLLNGRIDYTVTLTNHGPRTLASATVTVDLPTPTGATSPDCTLTTGKATCTTTGLAPGAGTTHRITVPVAVLSLGTPYTVTATRTTSTPTDPNPANDSASRTCTATTALLINCT
ncbi:hypothetical protein [Streptomyces sp. NPDC059863]|uniref:hypothetical protein n=1 Tax=unclassified Streptomyces TaxID=2593676 RepID=UPI003664F081